MPNTNEKRIVGAAGRRFEPVTGIPEQEMEIMGEALPTLKKGLGAAAYMAAAIAPGTGEYIAYKDYKHFTKESLKKAEEYKKLRGMGATRREAGIGGLIGNRALQLLSGVGMIPLIGYAPRVAKTMLRHQITGAIQKAAQAGLAATAPKAVRVPFVKVVEPGGTPYEVGQVIPQSDFESIVKEGVDSTGRIKPEQDYTTAVKQLGEGRRADNKTGLIVEKPFEVEVDPNQYFPQYMTDARKVHAYRMDQKEIVDQVAGEKLPTKLNPETTGGKIADEIGPIQTNKFKPVFGIHSYETLADLVEKSAKGKNPKDPVKSATEWIKFDDTGKIDENYKGWFQQQGVKKQELKDSGLWNAIESIAKKNGTDAPIDAAQLMRVVEGSPISNLQIQTYGHGQLRSGYRGLMLPIQKKIKDGSASPTEKLIYKHFGESDEKVLKRIFKTYGTSSETAGIRGRRGLTEQAYESLQKEKVDYLTSTRAFEKDIKGLSNLDKELKTFDLKTGKGIESEVFSPKDKELLAELSAVHKTELNPNIQSFRPRQYSQPDYTYLGGEDYMEHVVRVPHHWGATPKAYGGHFPDENPLFFMRTSKHTTPEGENVLVIHEVQGDLISDIRKGEKAGMDPFPKDPDMTKARELRKELNDLQGKMKLTKDKILRGEDLSVDEVQRHSARMERETRLNLGIAEEASARKVMGAQHRESATLPYTPLADNQMMNDTALKLASRIAAEKKYDYVAIYPAARHGGKKTGHSRNYGDEKGFDSAAEHVDATKQKEMRKSKAFLPTTADKLAKITGTETKTISVRAIPKVNGKEPKAMVGIRDAANERYIPFKYFADKKAAQKFIKEEFGDISNLPREGVSPITLEIDNIAPAPARTIDMYALKVNDKFKEPIPLYKRDGGVISLLEGLDLYYG